MTQSRKIAITGGIGSGKSEVGKLIASAGFPVLSCDKIYHSLLQDGNFLLVLSQTFGDILTEDGKLDRRKLSSIVFNDKAELEKLNNLTHPIVMQKALEEMDKFQLSFCEVPLLFEGGYEKLFDNVIVVMRDMDKRLAALEKRDNLSKEELIARINSQFDYDKSDLNNYYVVHNDKDLDYLKDGVIYILKKIQGNSDK